MKKKVLASIFFIAALRMFGQDFQISNILPDPLKGIWEGKDRYVLFSENSIALKTFYGWYLDRAAENELYTSTFMRDKNNTTSEKKQEDLEISYTVLTENEAKTSGAYEINILYGGSGRHKEKITIPVAVIDGKLYLNFLTKKEIDENKGETDDESQFMNGYWKNNGHAWGIKVSPPIRDKELVSYFFNESDVYYIRYWLSDMEPTAEEIANTKATFSDGNKVFYVDKFIKNGSLLYTCTTGRSTTIRNIQKTSASNMKFIVNNERTVCILESEYLTKIDENGTIENLQSIVAKANARRKNPPKPLFPPSQINFYWKEIGELEKYNPWTWNRRNIDIHKQNK